MKFNQVVVKICLGVFVIFGLTQCVVTPEESNIDPITGQLIDGVCFETEILPLMVSRCGNSGCHNATDRADGIDLTSYEAIRKEVKPGNPGDSELVEYMYETGEDAMPPAPAEPLKSEQIKLVEDWINEGARNTVDCESSGACNVTSPISFKNDVLPIIDNYCYGCHNTADPQGGYSYSTHSETMKSVNDGTLMGSIRFESGYVAMPEDSKMMPTCNIDLIQLWIDEGALNN